MTRIARLGSMALLCLVAASCDRPSTPTPAPAKKEGSAGEADKGSPAPGPNVKDLTAQAQQMDEEILGALRLVVRSTNYLVQCKFLKEGDLAAAERALRANEESLQALQQKALERYAAALVIEPANPEIFRARGALRWRWLVSSTDMRDEADNSLRRKRTEIARAALKDLDQALAIDPKDVASRMLRGRITLLEWADIHFFMTDFGLSADSGISPAGGVGMMMDAAEGVEGIRAGCDRAIADFTQVTTLAPGDPEGFYGRALAFWYKAQTGREEGGAEPGTEGEIHARTEENLTQARKNIEQAQFLQPQVEKYTRLARAIAGYWTSIPVPAVAVAVAHPDKTAQEVYRDAADAVVEITVQLDNGTATGSGSILTDKGLILTNQHVVAGASRITVTLRDRRSFGAEFVANHEKYDLALIRISASVENLSTLNFAIGAPAVGDDLVIIGHPKGMKWTLTAGKISQFRGSQVDSSSTVFLQTDAAANPGNSGGPVLNMRGSIVGVVTSKLEDSEGMTFAIYKDIAIQFFLKHR